MKFSEVDFSMSLVFQKTIFHRYSFPWGIFFLGLSRWGITAVGSSFFGENFPWTSFFLGRNCPCGNFLRIIFLGEIFCSQLFLYLNNNKLHDYWDLYNIFLELFGISFDVFKRFLLICSWLSLCFS